MVRKQRNYTHKLFFAYSTATLVVLFLLISFILVFIYREEYDRSLDTQIQLVAKMEEQIDVSLQSMDRIINGLLFNKDFLDIIQDEQALLHYTRNSKQVLNSFITLDAPLFPSHRIIAFNGEIYYNLSKTGEDQIHIKESLQEYFWWEKIVAEEGSRVILPVHQDPFEPTEFAVYSVARSISDGKQSLGIIEVQNSYSQLAAFCELGTGLGEVVVFSGEGDIVYPYPADRGEEQAFANVYETTAAADETSGSFRLEGRLVTFSVSSYSGWTTVIYNPVGNIVPYAFQLIALALIAFALLAFVTLVLLRVITKRLTAPLVSLNEALSEVSLENLSLQLPESGGIKEIETINHSFNIMFSHLRATIAESIQARAGEERASYLALQSQMNPHTIYNTITMIESVSYMHGDKEVSKLCICFSEMLRYISDYEKREYSLADELGHLQNYIVLITKRYEGLLHIEVDADEALYSQRLPKFILQPLVENAVKHGMGGGSRQLKIWVIIRPAENGWQISILDNGSGFSQESLAEIERQLIDCDESLGTSGDVANRKIGNLSMSNIYIRCRILFGGGFSFHMGNREQEGACVELYIPAEKEEERD